MPQTTKVKFKGAKNFDYYEIAMQQITQQILPSTLPATTVWAYGPYGQAGGIFNAPSLTIEARWNRPCGSSGSTT